MPFSVDENVVAISTLQPQNSSILVLCKVFNDVVIQPCMRIDFYISSKIEVFSMQAELGRQLAEMHKAGTSEKGYGFDVDNTIGR